MTSADDFIGAFTDFLRDVVDTHAREPQAGPFTETINEHLGVDAREASVVTERFSRARFVDADVALATLDPQARLVGFSGNQGDLGLAGMLRGEHGPVDVGPVEYTTAATGPGRERQVVAAGVRLLRVGVEPVVVLQRDARPQWGLELPQIEVIAADHRTSGTVMSVVRDLMREHSVLRGQVLSFDDDEYGDTLGGVTFHERPQVSLDHVVLPDGALERLERHVVAIGQHRDAMLRAGQHLKRGILLYGPPGTGKTHTIRYLLGRTEGSTAILLSGNMLRLVREAATLARVLAPAVVVLEDCDLVAEDRDMVDSPDSMLFELLEALDGLDGDADVAFVLTTNRPDLLERALAQRPGRVDLAVEIPLPDAPARRRLFALYAGGRGFSDDAVREAADRADGVTASFAKELVRRAVLTAAIEERPTRDDDLRSALDELLSDRETFTRSLLASGSRAFADLDGFGPEDMEGEDGWAEDVDWDEDD